MISAIALCILLATFLFGKLYPKETLIVWALIILIVVAYPFITNLEISRAALCSSDITALP